MLCILSYYFQIEDGEIYASINQKDGMVCFHDNPEKYNNPAMLHKIDQEVMKLHNHPTDLAWDLFKLTCLSYLFIFFFSDVEMYRAGWKAKVYGSRNYSKSTICAEGETVFLLFYRLSWWF